MSLYLSTLLNSSFEQHRRVWTHEEEGLAGSAVAGETCHAPLGPLDADGAASVDSAAKAVASKELQNSDECTSKWRRS